jgi:tripartite ATP-independent transporter DctM subunit
VTLIGVAAFLLILMLLLLAGGVWIAMTLAIVGFTALAFFTGTPPGKNLFTAFWGSGASWTLAALPMFIWMGEILFRTRLSRDMFEGLAPWLDRIPGRLMHVGILGCGIFGSLGSLATAGTLGILIPPSITMIVYAVAADASIIRVFLAGFIPGAILMLLFSGYIAAWAIANPDKTPPPAAPTSFMQKVRASGNLIPVTLLIVLIVWVLVTGVATATECAAYGVLGSLAIAWWSGSLTWRNFLESLMSATRVSCMIMFILAGASYLSLAMGFTGIPRALAEWVASLGLSPLALIAALAVFYIVLGMALDGISMIVLTAAIVLPMVQKAGFDLIWFGIFVVLLVEIAEVTPPVGFNLFVLQNMTGKDSNEIARAAIPFFALLVVTIGIITVFPQVVTWLPDAVMGAKK